VAGISGECPRRAIDRQRIGEEPDNELLTLCGTTVARSSLSTQTNDGRAQDTGGAWVAAGAFAAFFEDREHRPEEAEAEEKSLNITAQPRDPSEKPREVFISYAWGDDTPAGKVRTRVVDALQEALAKQEGFLPVRDRDQVKNGDLISAFIRRLTRADLVVGVISDKYLRSIYCMHEIYKLWQRHQANPDEMAQHLVPIVLPEVKIGNVRERLPYLKYWAGEAKSLEKVVRDANIRPGRESWEEVRLVREFSHHIDDILVFLQDVLMPKALDAHLEDGFPAVLEALRRRIGA
jgi:internalin A